MIYLDNAATTKPDKRVLSAAAPYIHNNYGNAGSIHSAGRNSYKGVLKAREQVAGLFHCHPDQVVFTSGGTEANNMVFNGLVNHLKNAGKTHILISSVEHDSVIHSAKHLAELGFKIKLLPVDSQGVVSAEDVERCIRPETGLVSVMYVNNETGSVNPIEEIGRICEEKEILFHTDCVQAAGTHRINVFKLHCDFASVSAHKIHGLKGVGALYVRDKTILQPTIFGGSTQEFGLRGGTENVPGIVAFGETAEITASSTEESLVYVSTLKQKFYTELTERCKTEVVVNGQSVMTPGKILNVQLIGVDGETLLLLLDAEGVCVSAGSACRSHESKPSHVLTAMGLSPANARDSIRISFSEYNTEEEIIEAAKIISKCVEALM